MDLALNSLQWLICHKTKLRKTEPVLWYSILITETIKHWIFNMKF